ncbi:arginine--tRNA ligase [Candidatus Dependentiae bacterium]|nr:arginine--tRNA ligase [Candidatus Dependentiae bacterium]
MNDSIKKYLHDLIINSLKNLNIKFETLSIQITFPDSRFGDYATNIALILAKQVKRNPLELAGEIIVELQKLDKKECFEQIYELKGFINFRISKKFLFEKLNQILKQQNEYAKSDLGKKRTVLIEYFQNNVAKPPHVGHLRSAVIGDCLLRVFKFLGFNAISDTHVGDWGTQFGILIYAFKTIGDEEIIKKDPINELNRLYVAISNKIEEDSYLKEKGKAEFKKLELGDPENRKLWQWFVEVSLNDFERYRELLGLLPFDYNLGESFYEKLMFKVLEEFKQKGLIKQGETGELYIDLEKYKLGRCILVKSDGATTYHLRDFATYMYRKEEFDFYKNIYVVDARQSHHFKQLFKALELAGYPALQDSVHVSFGFMSLPEGPISTRKGNIVSLQKLIDEAENRSLEIIEEKNPELPNKQEVAKKVGLAAIKYFDLVHNRNSNFVFKWEKALSFEGNTGPYMQYTYARIHGILRKAKNLEIEEFGENLNLKESESDLLRKLMQFEQILEEVIKDYMPNYLCNYLFELSQYLNKFYQNVNVLKEKNKQILNFRLKLITATAQVIKNGLYLLGIDSPERM